MRRRSSHAPRDKGFALVITVIVLMLLVLMGAAMLHLSVLELRKGADGGMAEARSNARLALQLALGQLQKELGPDQRITASGEVLGSDDSEAHRTGVWRTVAGDGKPWVRRDPATGGWIDTRAEGAGGGKRGPVVWLDSGQQGPTVEILGRGTVAKESDFVRVGLRELQGRTRGRLAWWTNELGDRAGLSLPGVGDAEPEFRERLISQKMEIEEWPEDEAREARRKVVSAGSENFVSTRDFLRRHFFDYWWETRSVLADVRDGGLKRDLTPYLLGSGGGEGDLNDATLLLAEPESSKLRAGAPTMGLLRSWARGEVDLSDGQALSVVPPSDPGRRDWVGQTLVNNTPVRLRNRQSAGLQPILVEGSDFLQLSVYRKAETAPGTSGPRFQMRLHHYPRVVLWNPYSVALEMDPMMVMIQGNGRQEVWTDNELIGPDGRPVGARVTSQWLFFEGGRSTSFSHPGGIMASEGYNDPYMGSYYYSLPRTRFGPGECLVFSPESSAEYNGQSAYHPGAYDLSANRLSCEVAPDPSRSYYISDSEINGGISYLPISFWYAVTGYWSQAGRTGVENQTEDTRVVMKAMSGSGPVTFERFDSLPLVSYISGSLQYGSGREPRMAWNDASRMPIELLDRVKPRPTLTPEVRTRDGVRLRWFHEHPSNLMGSGALNRVPAHFQEAALANWNPRAAYAVRSPWENIAGTLPVSGVGSGPWFFGIYTRDLFDEAVSWESETPVRRNGRYHGNPFGLPQEGEDRYIAFDLPREGVGVMSLAQFQHVRLSEFIWHPSYAAGNSLADPRLGLEGLWTTVPSDMGDKEAKLNGFESNAIGWSTDSQRASSRDAWAATGRALMQGLPEQEPVVYDLSFEVNQALWDRYFLSTGEAEEKQRFANDAAAHPLPNKRMQAVAKGAKWGDLRDPLRAASSLMLSNALNVNSTSVEAWKALLTSARSPHSGKVCFPRFVAERHEAVHSSGDRAAWTGTRELDEEEVERLAQALVAQVKRRGPFLSVADFVNRRLVNDETGHSGALQAAIDEAGLNAGLERDHPLDNQTSLPNYRHPDGIRDATRLEQQLKPKTKMWGAPGFLTQADVLQVIGPALTARSDRFLIRGYGEAVDGSGRVTARAWCEAEVQRTPEPVAADASGLESRNAGKERDVGRRFEMISFRWLRPEDV